MFRPALTSLCAAGLLALAACTSLPKPDPAPLTLHIAHINDHHSNLEPFAGTELLIDGEPTQVDLGGFARQTALFKALDGTPNLLKLHAGDALTGTLYYTFFKGRADAQMMNTICFDAMAVGNHEFDDGDAVLRDFLDALGQGPCQTPVLSANVLPAEGSPLNPGGRPPYLRPWVVREVGGVKVGIVGLTIAGKTQNSSRPLATTRFLPEVAAAQAAIDQLKAQGVHHIVLLTHQGYAADQALAAQLTDVDVIIGGDSHTLLGDFSAHGVPSAGPYPTSAYDRRGQLVCIAQAWEYSKALGLLRVQFDGRGRVLDCEGQASLVVGETLRRRNAQGEWQPLPEAEQAALRERLRQVPTLKLVAPDPQAQAVLATYTAQVEAEKARPIGEALDALCLVRSPGEATARSAGVPGCEQAHRLARGSDAAQVVAEAFLRGSRRADIALQNAGGVRIPIRAGRLTMKDAFSVLPFANTLVELDLSGAEIHATLEDAVANYLDQRLSDGAHPYAAGLRWHLDMSQARGQRFSRLEVRDKTNGQWAPLDPLRIYTLVTHDFIASGRDGYTTLGRAFAQGRAVNTYLLYTQTFVDHLQALGSLRRPPASEVSHQQVITSQGQKLP